MLGPLSDHIFGRCDTARQLLWLSIFDHDIQNWFNSLVNVWPFEDSQPRRKKPSPRDDWTNSEPQKTFVTSLQIQAKSNAILRTKRGICTSGKIPKRENCFSVDCFWNVQNKRAKRVLLTWTQSSLLSIYGIVSNRVNSVLYRSGRFLELTLSSLFFRTLFFMAWSNKIITILQRKSKCWSVKK